MRILILWNVLLLGGQPGKGNIKNEGPEARPLKER